MWNMRAGGVQGYMAALSLDLRQRIISTCDRGEGTQEQIARRFGVSYGMDKKLLQQRRTPVIEQRQVRDLPHELPQRHRAVRPVRYQQRGSA